MIEIIGEKLGMTSIFNKKNGNFIPCTIINVEPCVVTKITYNKFNKNKYIQIGFNKTNKKINKSIKGIFIKNKLPIFKKLYEFKINKLNNIKIGYIITINEFKKNDLVKITGISKGKGFQGVVKRHNFSGVGGRTHGQHNRLRSSGSIGAGSSPSRVFKGMKMSGKTGNKKITIKNLKILKIDNNNNILIIKGSIPGIKKSYIIIKK